MKQNNDAVLNTLLSYADNDNNIRVVLMEGSRAFEKVDRYSDYDIVYVTQSNEPYFNGAILPFLIKEFGEIAVMQTPDNGDPHNVYTHLVQFASGLRIDLTFNSVEFLSRISLESATAILLDKDGMFAKNPPPSDSDFWIKPPSTEEFRSHCNQFWWCSPYVAKAAARNQTLHALEILNERVRAEYVLMLSYLAGARNNWERVNSGKHYTDIARLLPLDDAHYYDTLLRSYVHADIKEIRLALETLMVKYDSLAAVVANELGYSYDT